MNKLDSNNLVRPYGEDIFVKQLRDSGIPQITIKKMRSHTINDKPHDILFFWLYEDIDKNEAIIENGARYSRVVGIFCTDGKYMLLERSTDLGKEGEKYKLGG